MKVTFQQSLFLKIVSDLRQVGGFLPVSSTNNTDRHDLRKIVESGVQKTKSILSISLLRRIFNVLVRYNDDTDRHRAMTLVQTSK